MNARSREETRARIGRWETAIRADSPMYSDLARVAAAEVEILDLLRTIPPGQMEMNLLLGAVQYMLLMDPSHELAAWYPSLGGDSTIPGLSDAFGAFVASNRDRIGEIVATRRVQTNEVARCVFLLPAYNLVAAMTGTSIALIEVGTSAGLNQNVDLYGYTFRGQGATWTLGESSAVQLTTDLDQPRLAAAAALPPMAWKTGLDTDPVDITNRDQALWLRALVWADRPDRHARLAAAIDIAGGHPPTLIAGDVFDVLPDLVSEAPTDAALVVQHSFVLSQMAAPDRERFYAALDDLARARPLYRVGAEWLKERGHTQMVLTVHGDARREISLATVHHHGEWIKWTLSGPA